MAVKLAQGWSRMEAGAFSYTSTAFPMLTGTLVTAAGYLPVGLARSSTGEYTQDIFRVVGLSLILSWLVAVLFVPLVGAALLPAARERGDGGGHDVYDTRFYHGFRRLVRWCVCRRWAVIVVTAAGFGAAVAGFARVPQQFFPASDRLEVLIDLRLPEGASREATTAAVARMEAVLKRQPGILSYAAYAGTGTPRFFLAFAPELDNPNTAQFVINTASIPAREALLATLTRLADRGAAGGFGDIRMRSSRLELGPPVGYPVQFRLIGPDPATLERIAGQVRDVLRANPHIRNVSDNTAGMAKTVTVTVDQNKARLLGASSQDVATTLATLEQGAVVTAYREGTDQIPVMVRAVAAERQDLAGLPDVMIPVAGGKSVPLSQIAKIGTGLETPTLWRRNRTAMVTVRGDIGDTTQAPVVTAGILPALAPIKAALPAGYRIETGGAVEESAKGQDSVNRVIPLMILVMLALLVLQLQNFGRVVMVLLTAPLGLIGVTGALLATGAPFGFVAMLGFIALAGIIMRNAIILVDQIDREVKAGRTQADAIVEATIRRARPILLTATAAMLALIPLAFSVFWGPMAIVLMGGLVSATGLTLGFVPALYAAWGRVKVEETSRGSAPAPRQDPAVLHLR
jgi:multidrug efflux pump